MKKKYNRIYKKDELKTERDEEELYDEVGYKLDRALKKFVLDNPNEVFVIKINRNWMIIIKKFYHIFLSLIHLIKMELIR